MANPLTRKLEAFAALPEADRHLLDDVVRRPRFVRAREDLIREGDDPSAVHLILEGFACRYKMLANGRRHIMAYLVPGDCGDPLGFILQAMDHSIATLSPCRVVDIPRPRIQEMTERPSLARALAWSSLVDEATLREWLVNIGARTAEERVAHLLCELLLRLETVGLADDGRYELPLTQGEIADTMGLSSIHVNRVLQSLRARELITLTGGALVIRDVRGLTALSGFNPNYLHLPQRSGSGAEGIRPLR